MLAGNPDEVRIFREDLPLALMDTAALFRLTKSVALGGRTDDDVRRELMELNDRLAIP